MPPRFIQDYRQWAQECDHLVETAASPRIRKTMLYTAPQWRALADKEEVRSEQARALKPRLPADFRDVTSQANPRGSD
jgi:hypothetical protein